MKNSLAWFAVLALLACGGTPTRNESGAGNTEATADALTARQVNVTISPAEASIPPGGTLALSAKVSRISNQSVTWAVVEGPAAGTVSSKGVYTAPSVPGTYHVTAASGVYPTRTATATVAVIAPAGAPAPSPAPSPTPTPTPSTFAVFDATAYSGKPDLTAYGLKPLKVIYAQQIWGPSWNIAAPPADLPPLSNIQALADAASRAAIPVVLDVERWPVANPFYSSDVATFQKALDGFDWIFDQFKQRAPAVQLGYFGVPPLYAGAYNLGGANETDLQLWADYNARLQPLADRCDALYPELYPWDQDPAVWADAAVKTIAKARELAHGKPVYAFVMPKWPDVNTPIPLSYWQFQLDTLSRIADGIVIWGETEPWDPNAPWWLATVQFMQQRN